jgi:hypothetical protein
MSIPDRPDVAEAYRPHGVAADLLSPPWPGAPTCACCTPDPGRRAALERLRTYRNQLAVSRAAHRLMPLRGCCGLRRWSA